jgi:hypothetical protein
LVNTSIARRSRSFDRNSPCRSERTISATSPDIQVIPTARLSTLPLARHLERGAISGLASSGTPWPAMTMTTRPNDAVPHRGTGTRPNHRRWTCSSSFDARSSPPDLLSPHHPDQRQPKKSWKSSRPGHGQPHNRESRAQSPPTYFGISRTCLRSRSSADRLA